MYGILKCDQYLQSPRPAPSPSTSSSAARFLPELQGYTENTYSNRAGREIYAYSIQVVYEGKRPRHRVKLTT